MGRGRPILRCHAQDAHGIGRHVLIDQSLPRYTQTPVLSRLLSARPEPVARSRPRFPSIGARGGADGHGRSGLCWEMAGRDR